MFFKPEDIGNRACQHVGAPRFNNFTDVSKQASEISFCYDKLRRAELRRSVWRFATRRCAIRPISNATRQFIPPTWVTGQSYAIGAIVQDGLGIYWICTYANTSNTLNGPGQTVVGQPVAWQQYFGATTGDPYDSTVSYYAGDIVWQSEGPAWFISLLNNNLGVGPGNTTHWTPLAADFLVYQPLIPAGFGVTIGGRKRNIYPLPYGYLRATYPDPKVESTSTNVTSAGLRFSDWQFENNYLISNSSDPIILRFVGDISDVTAMDDLFCEGLAARIAYEVCEPITQSNIKLQAIAAAYQKFIKDARDINWIETGATEPQEDDYQLTQGPAGVAESSIAAAQGQQAQNIGGR